MNRAKPIFLATMYVCYAGLFGEAFLRLFSPQPIIPRYVTGGEGGIRANMPSVTFRQWTPEVDVRVHYNSAGMRDDRPPPPQNKSGKQCRIALLGDSFFVGFESDYAHSFPKKLEDDLKEMGYQCRVLNFAVSGFGTAEMLISLRDRAYSFHPDVVVMSWNQTDPVDNVRSGLYLINKTSHLVRARATYLPGIGFSDRLMQSSGYRWLIENSHLYSAIRERVGIFVKEQLARIRQVPLRGNAQASDDRPKTGSPRPGNRSLDDALILEVKKASSDIGAHFLLFDVPFRQSRTRFKSMVDWISPEVRSALAVSDPTVALGLVARPNRLLYLERGEGHWSELGNAISAKVAADDLVARGWLKPFEDKDVIFEEKK